MLKRITLLITLILLSFLAGCGTKPPPKPQLTPLQIEAMQTQSFNTAKRDTFDGIMTVLQNEGYVVQAANYDTGFITAKSAENLTRTAKDVFVSYNEFVNAFITPVKDSKQKETKVRLNFVIHFSTSDKNGTRTQDKAVSDPEVYKRAFNDIRQQLFVAPDIS
jgi:predicted small lipoprotein YifL